MRATPVKLHRSMPATLRLSPLQEPAMRATPRQIAPFQAGDPSAIAAAGARHAGDPLRLFATAGARLAGGPVKLASERRLPPGLMHPFVTQRFRYVVFPLHLDLDLFGIRTRTEEFVDDEPVPLVAFDDADRRPVGLSFR